MKITNLVTNPTTDKRKWRPSWLPKDISLQPEIDVHPHSSEERGELFLAHNMGSTEIETLNWIHATACLTKPQNILETGAFDGIGTLALASACRDNGFGMVHSVEISKKACKRLEKRLIKYGLDKFVEIHCNDSIEFLNKTELIFDMGFFDSMCEIRADEYRICLERRLITGIAIFHDTSVHRCLSFNKPTKEAHDKFRHDVLKIAQNDNHSGFFEHNLSRGLIASFQKITKTN